MGELLHKKDSGSEVFLWRFLEKLPTSLSSSSSGAPLSRHRLDRLRSFHFPLSPNVYTSSLIFPLTYLAGNRTGLQEVKKIPGPRGGLRRGVPCTPQTAALYALREHLF